MAKHQHPELEGREPQTLYTFELKKQGQTVRERLTWIITGLCIGLGVAAGVYVLSSIDNGDPLVSRDSQNTTDDPFKQGSVQAMGAAELTQTAEFREDWVEVVMLWQQAITHMKAVGSENPNYSLAHQKVKEYERNLQYAQSNVDSRPSNNPSSLNYWTIGSDRQLVLAVQGIPSRVSQYDTSCYEVLHYGGSMVELTNGYVTQYDNFDDNLKVLTNGKLALSIQKDQQSWTLGSTKEEVFRLQGTPTRTDEYQSNDLVVLYYNDSSVFVEDGHVVSYRNASNNLKVSTVVPASMSGQAKSDAWSLGAGRTDVLSAQQQTPMAIKRNDETCEEVFQFGDSEVFFRQGLVTGYSNASQNLRIR